MPPSRTVIGLLVGISLGSCRAEPIVEMAPEISGLGIPNSVVTVDGGSLFLSRLGVETRRAEFLDARDCRHAATILAAAEPGVEWYCGTSTPDLTLECVVHGYQLAPEAAETGFGMPESLTFTLVLNRGSALGESSVGVPLTFGYTVSESAFRLVSDYPFAEGNYFTSAVNVLVIAIGSGAVEVFDIAGAPNGDGLCAQAMS